MIGDFDNERAFPRIFSYWLLRLAVGVIAILIAWAVVWLNGEELPSISAAYWTDGRDVFVGSLFVVAAFLLAYNGRNWVEFGFSKIAGLSCLVVAVVPTDQKTSAAVAVADHIASLERIFGMTAGEIHNVAAYVFFSALLGIGLVFFYRAFYEKQRPKRATLYAIGCLGIVVAGALGLRGHDVFTVEVLALNSFGLIWIVSGLYPLVDTSAR